MIKTKQLILQNLCYTDLVYDRINKKMGTAHSRTGIEHLVYTALSETDAARFVKQGKNYYATCNKYGMRVTINSHTFRIITVDHIKQ